MRKNLNLKLSWYTPENLNTLIEDGYLPVFVMKNPAVYKGTPIHFPKLVPHGKNITEEEYRNYLEKEIVAWKIINSFDVLSHVSCAPKGVVLLTSTKDDPFRKILGEYLGRYLENKITEYEYNRDSDS